MHSGPLQQMTRGNQINTSRLRLTGKPTIAAVVASLFLLLLAANAGAAPAGPIWTITSISQPTYFAPGDRSGDDQYLVTATNNGGGHTNGSAITISDRLPAGVRLDKRAGVAGQDDAGNRVKCSAGPTIKCTDAENVAPLQPGQVLAMTVHVNIAHGAPAKVTNQVSVSGGGAGSASSREATTIASTRAQYRFQHVDGWATEPNGDPDTQAGSHPWGLTTTFNLTTHLTSSGKIAPVGSARDIRVAIPAGVIGNPLAVPRCTAQELASSTSPCPNDAQVGVVAVLFADAATPIHEPVYNMVAPPGMPAQLGFHILTTEVYIDTSVRTGGNYGLNATLLNLPQALQLAGSTLTLWGTPGDPSHDIERCRDMFSGACPKRTPYKGRVEPFMTLPTACLGPQKTTFRSDSWQKSARFASASFLSHDNRGHPVGASGCKRLPFSPSLTVKPTVNRADSPSGLNVELKLPNLAHSKGLAEAELKDVTVILPQGMSVSPPAAEGRKACSEAEIGLHDAKKPTCPPASVIGSVEITTPLLRVPLSGAVYLAAQGKNPFGSLLAIYLAARARGVQVKLAGHVIPNHKTGQLTTTFSDNPQLPFTDLKLSLSAGPRAPLAMPDSCGTYVTNSSLTPWSGTKAQSPSVSFKVSSGCVSGFKPSFRAAARNPVAGAFTAFSVSFSRNDQDQFFSGLSVNLPEGLLAKLAGVKLCTDRELAAAAASSGKAERAHPSCPVSALVGHAETAAGPGPRPFRLPGNVYLTGRYKGAPYGLAVVVPAVAGPFDLGTVVVRQALHVDPYTAQVDVVSDPLPYILKGIPLRIRSVQVVLDRPHFTLNPTSCQPMSVTATLSSTQGTNAMVASPFEAAHCSRLAFRPSLTIGLSGAGRTRSGDHPTLTSTLTQPHHEANLLSASVKLPLSLALDPNNSRHVCPYKVAKKVRSGPVHCPADTIIGSATAVTPLLSRPLKGKVYLVQGITFIHGQPIRTLPTLLVALRGQIALDLKAKTSVVGRGALVTTFPAIPDAPVSRFTLTIKGGRKGILVVTGNHIDICRKPQIAHGVLDAQNGKSRKQRIKMTTPCGRATSRRSGA